MTLNHRDRNDKMRSFRCEEWLFASMNEVARLKGINYSEWIRKTLTEALYNEGITAANWYNRRENRDK